MELLNKKIALHNKKLYINKKHKKRVTKTRNKKEKHYNQRVCFKTKIVQTKENCKLTKRCISTKSDLQNKEQNLFYMH